MTTALVIALAWLVGMYFALLSQSRPLFPLMRVVHRRWASLRDNRRKERMTYPSESTQFYAMVFCWLFIGFLGGWAFAAQGEAAETENLNVPGLAKLMDTTPACATAAEPPIIASVPHHTRRSLRHHVRVQVPITASVVTDILPEDPPDASTLPVVTRQVAQPEIEILAPQEYRGEK